jgi:regulatory protein
MAGKVTSLQYQKRSPDRVNVYLDGKFALALPETEAAALHQGQYLSDEDINRLKLLDAEQKAYERAVHFLSYRVRSRAEVERNLSRAGIDEVLVARVIERLGRQGLLDDSDFARAWVDNRERFQPRGQRALRYELRQKGVDDETIAAALEDVDQVAGAYRAAQARAQRLAALARSDPQTFRRKLGEFLARRGFDYDIARQAVRQLEEELGLEADPDEG